MSRNSPGQDPWGRRDDGGPPDLDEVFRRLQKRLRNLFGGRGGGGNGAGLGGLVALLVLFAAAWFVYGFYIVDEGERGVVLRFGRHVDTTLPGLHWHAPIAERVERVNVTRIRSVDGTAHVLTGDENIVELEYAIQYRVTDPAAYLFNVRDPDLTLQQAAESAFREVVGKNTFDFVIQEGRDLVPQRVRELLQQNLDQYGTGHEVVAVNLIKAQPPQAVQAAFDDAIKAREDKDRIIQEAEVYANDVVPKARGNARRLLEEAEAYKFAVVAKAKGEAERFSKLLEEYRRAPEVTRRRLYLETLEAVLGNSAKVLVDVDSGSNLLYLPLDRLLQGAAAAAAAERPEEGSREAETARESRIDVNTLRSRGGR